MNTSLKEKFLNLSPAKKALVREYYRIYSDADLPPDKYVERISEIWNRVTDDPETVACLELIEYFYSDVNEDECVNDKRAYLSEYLFSEVGLESTAKSSFLMHAVTGSLILRCPNGEYVLVNDPKSLQNWICSICGTGKSKHEVISYDYGYETTQT